MLAFVMHANLQIDMQNRTNCFVNSIHKRKKPAHREPSYMYRLLWFFCFLKDIAIVNDSKRTTTCRAESDVELLVISKSVSLWKYSQMFYCQVGCCSYIICHLLINVCACVFLMQDYLDLSLRQAQKSYQKTKHFAFCRYVLFTLLWLILLHWSVASNYFSAYKWESFKILFIYKH